MKWSRGFLFYTTHVSDPLPAAVGSTVIEVILRERLAEHALAMGSYFVRGLRELSSGTSASATSGAADSCSGASSWPTARRSAPSPSSARRCRDGASSSGCG
ncbi:MAG TPA: hypothetical protein VLK65_30010 [Vicinamibacteria bacterium]|nr:hypothetical protein [Vicinamibacteria bacterium]